MPLLKFVWAATLSLFTMSSCADTGTMTRLADIYSIAYDQSFVVRNMSNIDITVTLSHNYAYYSGRLSSVSDVALSGAQDEDVITLINLPALPHDRFNTNMSVTNQHSGERCMIVMEYDTDAISIVDRNYSLRLCDEGYQVDLNNADEIEIEVTSI